MLAYRDHIFALVLGTDLPSTLLASLRADPTVLRSALDGWLESRKAELDLASISVLALEGDPLAGSFELAFHENSWQSCRMEWASAPHNPRVQYRIQGESLILSTLPRDAFGERVDDL